MRILILILLLPLGVWAQYSPLPFELERYPAAHYQQILNELAPNFNSEGDALAYYMVAYKLQRSENPANYFIAPNQARNEASAYLTQMHGNGDAIKLVSFLESRADAESSSALLNTADDYPELLPYQFLAANLLRVIDKEQSILLSMNQQNMLSETLIAFGQNALLSANGSQLLLTQGLQDLIGIRFAMLQNGDWKPTENYLVASCKAYTGDPINTMLSNPNTTMWVSPAMAYSFYATYINQLWIAGIGMKIQNGPEINPDAPMNLAREVGTNFVGLKSKPTTPADFGLISVYKPFADKFYEISLLTDSNSVKAKAKKIKKYAAQQQ